MTQTRKKALVGVSVSDHDTLGLTDLDLKEPAVLAARTAFPPTDFMEEYEELVAKLNKKRELRKSRQSSVAAIVSQTLHSLPTRELVERMKNGLSHKDIAEIKQVLIKEYGRNANDSGRTEAQVALLTARIEILQRHLGTHKKDHHSRRGLIILASQRTRLLRYLKRSSETRYQALLKSIGIRDSV